MCSSCRCCCRCAVLFVRCRCAVVISLVMAAVVLSSLLCGCGPLGCPCCRQDPHCRVTCLAVVGIVIGVGLVHSCVAVGVNSRRQDKQSQKNKQVALFVVRARVRAWEAPFLSLTTTVHHSFPFSSSFPHHPCHPKPMYTTTIPSPYVLSGCHTPPSIPHFIGHAVSCPSPATSLSHHRHLDHQCLIIKSLLVSLSLPPFHPSLTGLLLSPSR